MKKSLRQQVHQKYDGRCAYCGSEIEIKQMHVDHVKPIYRGNESVNPKYLGSDTIDNMMPACKPCNLWKGVYSVEQFRSEMAAQVERLRRDSAGFRMAERYGQIRATDKPVFFWFERCVPCIHAHDCPMDNCATGPDLRCHGYEAQR